MTRSTGLSMALAVALAATGCQREGRDAVGLPPQPEVVEVTLGNYRFDYRAPTTSGRVVFRIRNADTEAHQFRLFPLGEEVPPLAEQLAGPTRRGITTVAFVIRQPGEVATLAVDLLPDQRYGMVCFVRDVEDLVVHADKGMASEFRTPGSPAEDPSPPEAVPSTAGEVPPPS